MPMTLEEKQRTIAHYYVTALWLSHDADGANLDENYDADDIAPESRASMAADVVAFIDLCEEDRPDVFAALEPEQVGHDFWLTRNGHGAGFWDRGLGETGDYLTKWAGTYGTSDLYIGDDGQVWVQ